MTIEYSELSSIQKKNKTNWLLATSSYFFVYPFTVFLLLVSFMPNFNLHPAYFFGFLIGNFIVKGIFFWIVFHCAYRKHGIGLLTFYLIAMPFLFLKDYINELRNPTRDFWITANFFIFESLFLTWWYIASLKLRKDNKNLQIQSFKTSDSYLKSVASISSAINFEDLQYKYHEAFRECPKHFADALKPHYNEMKLRLEKPSS